MTAAEFMRQCGAQFVLSAEAVTHISMDMATAMRAGLQQRESSLRMLPSYLSKPIGNEQGLFAALDFGGTNARALLVELSGDRQIIVRRRVVRPLCNQEGRYDYRTASAPELFDFLARLIAEAVQGYSCEKLGFTFSFPCQQHSAADAKLLHWTKELAVPGVQGRSVGELLAAALARRGLVALQPVAVINDTIGTLLTAAYSDAAVDIGSICGTGHNSCYVEPQAYGADRMLINMESGNFTGLPQTDYDALLDAASRQPGQQRLEKQVSGRYIGELFRLIACDAVQAGCLSAAGLDGLHQPYAWGSREMAGILASDSGLLAHCAQMLFTRSARLVAAEFTGIIRHIDPALRSRHTVAIDGSLYEKVSGYRAALALALAEQGLATDRVRLQAVADGSGCGAAVAAACVVC